LQVAVWRWRSGAVKELDIAVLRHELAILRRHTKRPALTTVDRLLLAASSRLLPQTAWSSFIITPRHAAPMASAIGGEMLDLPTPRTPADPR
jgi:hypothetical protein